MRMMASSHLFKPMNDDQLYRLLREAPPEAPVPDSFGREVWARIEAEESLTFAACATRLSERFFAWLARPMPSLVTIASCILLGALFGASMGRTDLASADTASNELSYVRSINPLGHHALKDE